MDGEALVWVRRILQPLTKFTLPTASLAHDEEQTVIRFRRRQLNEIEELPLSDERSGACPFFSEGDTQMMEGVMGLRKERVRFLSALGPTDRQYLFTIPDMRIVHASSPLDGSN